MPSFHIVGAGGIGCALGHTLRTNGVEVIFVDARASKVHRGRDEGVTVQGRPPQAATFLHFDEWRPSPDAVTLLCTKCYDNQKVLDRVSSAARLVPVQNGFDSLLLASDYRVEGIASFVSECEPDRPRTRITRAGALHLGPRDPASRDDELIGNLVRSLRGGPFRLHVVADVRPYKNTKLMYNAAIGPLAAAAGLDNGDLLRLPSARRLFFELLRENHTILRAAGRPLGKVGPLHPSTVSGILSRPWLANLMARFFSRTLRGTYCSMARDLPEGPTELEHYTGYLLQLAGSTPCPLTRRLHALVCRMVAERTPPSVEVLEQLVG